MSRARRYDRVEPYRPPTSGQPAASGQPAPAGRPGLHPRSHAKPSAEADAGSLVPPELEAVDVDGVAATTIGTVLWGLAFVALLPFRASLDANGRGWWLWTCLAGFGLGLWGIAYCRHRRASMARAHRGHRR